MENKYTPGPWFVFETNSQMNFNETTVCKIRNAYQVNDFYIVSNHNEHGDPKATANLIAAAPELLDALLELKNWVGKLSDWQGQDPPCEIVDKAIKKATL